MINKRFYIFDLIGIVSILIYLLGYTIILFLFGTSSSDFPFEFESGILNGMIFISLIACISVFFSKHRYFIALLPIFGIFLMSVGLLISVDYASKITGIYCIVSSFLIIASIVYRIIEQKSAKIISTFFI